MTLIVAFIVAHLGAIGGILVGLLGVGFGAFRHKQAQATEAKATAAVATSNAAVAEGNSAAYEAASQHLAARVAADADAQKIPDADLDARGAELGILRKD